LADNFLDFMTNPTHFLETLNMKSSILSKFTFRPVRIVVAFIASVFLLFSNSVPAFAFGAAPSSPTDGTVQLNKIEERAQDLAESKAAPGSIEESVERAKGGINEVQGAADKDQMSRPGNSQKATSIKDEIGKALKKAAN
jgi:hypothetical protein